MLKKIFIACLCIAGLRADYDLIMDVELSCGKPKNLVVQNLLLHYSVAIPEVFPDGSWRIQAELLPSTSGWVMHEAKWGDETLDLEEFESMRRIDFVLDKNWVLQTPNDSGDSLFDLLFNQALRFFVKNEREEESSYMEDDSEYFLRPCYWSCNSSSTEDFKGWQNEIEFRCSDEVGFGDTKFFTILKDLKGNYKTIDREKNALFYTLEGTATARIGHREYYPHKDFLTYEQVSDVPCTASVKLVLSQK